MFLQHVDLKNKSFIVRYVYSLLFYLYLPFLLLKLLWRARRQPEYRERIAERLGFTQLNLSKSIWVHAVSVGESIAAIALIKPLQSICKDIPIIVTTMTPTGAAIIKQAFGEGVIHRYIPYDLPSFMSRFLNQTNPEIGIIMETELWPNLLACAAKKGVTMCLVNARLSQKSAQGYARIPGLTKSMLHCLSFIAAHGEKDAQRFIDLGANPSTVSITGNIKFDLVLPKDLPEKGKSLRDFLGKDRFIWIAASTHEGEEEQILAAHQQIRLMNPKALLILVPRHPNRFTTVSKLCEQSFKTIKRSSGESLEDKTAVYLGDTMGELLLLYCACDVAFVGGSLIPRGGHNMLEPAALGKPIMTGPHLFNFAEISELFIQANALKRVSNAKELGKSLIKLSQQPAEREAMGAHALRIVEENRGALSKQLELIKAYIQK